MAEDTYACKHCPAQLESREALKAHNDGFHPAGAATPIARLVPPGTTIAEGKDLGPAVIGLASEIGDVKDDVADHEERLKALEDGTRSSVDLEVLADQLVDRIQARVTASPVTAPEPAAAPSDETSYADLQARAKELGIPAVGTRESLADAITAEEAKTGAGG